MRFIFGLIVGALATLFIAAAFDAPADHLVGKLVHTTARLSDRFAEPQPPEDVRPADAVMNADQEAAAVAVEPAPATDPVAEIGAEAPEPAETVALVDDPGMDLFEDFSTDEVGQMAEQNAATAWGPFHSEASARGFARRLSRETGRSFTVEKRGPGDYAVMFRYAGEADLSAMRAQIAEVTGIPQS